MKEFRISYQKIYTRVIKAENEEKAREEFTRQYGVKTIEDKKVGGFAPGWGLEGTELHEALRLAKVQVVNTITGVTLNPREPTDPLYVVDIKIEDIVKTRDDSTERDGDTVSHFQEWCGTFRVWFPHDTVGRTGSFKYEKSYANQNGGEGASTLGRCKGFTRKEWAAINEALEDTDSIDWEKLVD